MPNFIKCKIRNLLLDTLPVRTQRVPFLSQASSLMMA
jgi:hypothetical protein